MKLATACRISQDRARSLRRHTLSALIVGISSLAACSRPGSSGTSAQTRRRTNTSLRFEVPHGDVRLQSVSDGDSFSVTDTLGTVWRVRIAGIDAPERKQAFGTEAHAILASLLQNKPLKIYPYKRDRYGRLVADVTTNGKDVGLAMIHAGAAWHYRRYAGEQPAQVQAQYNRAEKNARHNQKGLWRRRNPLAPWDYRTRRRRTAS